MIINTPRANVLELTSAVSASNSEETAAAKPPTESKLKSGLKRALGLLRQLSDSTMRIARSRAHTHLLANVYDDINIIFKVAEQILGRSDSQQNGMCAAAFELYGAPWTI